MVYQIEKLMTESEVGWYFRRWGRYECYSVVMISKLIPYLDFPTLIYNVWHEYGSYGSPIDSLGMVYNLLAVTEISLWNKYIDN